MKPLLKWVGGKTQIISDIMTRFPPKMTHYHEPFLGGGSVLLALLTCMSYGTIHVSGTLYASDVNSNLIGLYQNVQKHPEEVIVEVKRIIDVFSSCKGTVVNRNAATLEEALTSPESYYFWIRTQFNSLSVMERMSIQGSAMLLFMNKTCFRGVYREGPRGFNVPFGNYKNPSIMEEEHLRHISRLIQPVVFRACSFTDALSEVLSGDFVYLDPPYAPENETSFVSYTKGGFSLDHHRALFRVCHDLSRKKVNWLLSNSDVPLVREAFPLPYTTHVLSCRRTIHSKKPDAKTNEVLVTNEEGYSVS